MSDLVTLVSEIRGDIHRGSNYDTRIKTAIRAAIKHYRHQRLGFNTGRGTLSTSASAEYVDPPVDFIDIDVLRYAKADQRRVIYPVGYDVIDEKARPGSVGQPTEFAMQDRQIRLFPMPDQTYTLMISYLKDLPEISLSASDAATNAWLDEGYDLIKQHAIADLHTNYIKGPESTQQAGIAKAAELDEFNTLKSRANRDQSTGRARPHPI